MISIDQQVLQECNQRRSFGLQDAEAGMEGIHPTGRDGCQGKRKYNNQTKMTREVHSNKLQAKVGHPGEDRMHATANYLHYRIKATLEVCEDCATEK